jgi:DNA-binding CsgD family transcriptional regulator
VTLGLTDARGTRYPDIAEWPLIGHTTELAQLTSALAERRGAVITGPTGVGKTTLVMMGVELAEDGGMHVVRVAGTNVWRALPFGAFAALLPPDPVVTVPGVDQQVELLRHYAQSLMARAEGRPLLVCVDDAHLLDDASAMLVHQLAQTRAATVLATVLADGRSDRPAPAPIVALWKDQLAERIELAPLDELQVNQLLTTVLGGPVDVMTLRQFYDHSLGNPLFLRELVSGARHAGSLGDERGSWQLRDALRPTARLVELVTLRFGELSAPERRVMELTALGEPLSQSTLDELAEPAAVESLEYKGLIASRMDGRRLRINVAHPIYGDVIRVGISARRERVLARSLAEATQGRRGEDTLAQASLRLVGGGGSADLLLAGAQAARIRHDHSLTERLARAAVEKGDRFEGRFLAAEAAHVRGRPEQAERELAALAADAQNEAERVRVAVLRFDNAFFLRAQADQTMIEELLDVVSDQHLRNELLTRRIYCTSFTRGPRAAVDAASDWMATSVSVRVSGVHVVVAANLTKQGRLHDAGAMLRQPAADSDRPGGLDDQDNWYLIGHRAQILMNLGRLAEAEKLLVRSPSDVLVRAADETAMVGTMLAGLYMMQGRVQSAYLQARTAYSLFLELGRPLAARWAYGAAAMALALGGQSERGSQMLAELDALGLPVNMSSESDIYHARAWVAAAAGDMGSARQYLETGAELGQDMGDLLGASRALHALARMGRARQVTDRLSTLAEQVDGELTATRARYASACASRSIEGLEAAAADFEGMGTILFAAEALGEAAVLLHKDGYTREAAANEHKASRLLARCEGAVTPFVRAIGARAQLTPAELDTALQAVAGSSDKEIANQMHLSVRTVENRLHRTYQKLGLTRRHELADALRDLSNLQREG